MAPLVSVVMASYNHAPYLSAAIESVRAQTLESLELVVVDDGSTDGSVDIATRYAEADPRVLVLTHPDQAHRGIGESANLARSATRGRYLFGLPSDDVLLSDTLERGVAFLEGHPDVGWVYGYADLIDAQGRRIEQEGRRGRQVVRFGTDLTGGGRIVERLVQWNSIPAMTVMWRRECRDQTGEEHPSLVYSDWELQTRAAAHWEVAFIPRVLALYRVHGANTSLDVARETRVARQLEVTKVLRERAPSVGGRLAEPRIRAALELQMGYLRFAAGEQGAEADLRAAFERDASLAGDARWLSDWLWARPLDELLLGKGPDFARWFDGAVRALLEPPAARTMRREAGAVRAQARAIRLARAGRLVGAGSSVLVAWALSPRRLRDRRLTSVLLDAAVRTRAGSTARRARRRLLRD
jgi:alpha-1,3-rhamnosyltransferase